MEIKLHRPSGFIHNAFGRASRLSAFFNGKRIGSLSIGETKSFVLADREGVLRVGITKADEGLALPHDGSSQDVSGCIVSSLEFPISADDEGKRLDIGTSIWVLFDVFRLCYFPFFSKRVFRIRRAL